MSGQVRNKISGGIFLSPVIQGRDISLSLPPEITPARSGLPAATPAFCGRAADLSALLNTLSPRPEARGAGHESPPAARVVAVCGLAGVGKTELALQAAHTSLASGWFPGGVLFADMLGYNLADRLEVGQALEGFLRALGVPAWQIPAEPRDRAHLYASILSAFARHERRILVLIDNATIGGHIEPLLPADESSRAIVTSRDSLKVPGGSQCRLSALTHGDSAELLHRVLNTAHASDTRIRDDPCSAGRIAEMCDGLPLALRIAGGLLAENPALPLATMAANLDDKQTRLDELTYPGGAVQASFDLSYQHLDPESARLFRLLPVNPGPDFSTEAAAALAGTDLAVTRHRLSALTYLVEHSTGANRWRMPGLVRLHADQHGLRHAQEDGRAQAFSRLLDHYLTATQDASIRLASGVPDPDAPRLPDREQALAWLDVEYPNLTAAVHAAAGNPAHVTVVSDLVQAMAFPPNYSRVWRG